MKRISLAARVGASLEVVDGEAVAERVGTLRGPLADEA